LTSYISEYNNRSFPCNETISIDHVMPIHQLNIRRIGAKIAAKYIHFKRNLKAGNANFSQKREIQILVSKLCPSRQI